MPTTPMIPLTIEVPQTTIEKIKALNAISGMSADEIINTFADAIEFKLNDEIINRSQIKINALIETEKKILQSAGINPDFLVSPIMQPSGISRGLKSYTETELPAIDPEKLKNYGTSDHPMTKEELNSEPNNYIDMTEDDEDSYGSLGGDEEDFDNMDVVLPDKAIEEMEDLKDEVGEKDMPIKDKEGNDSGYEDDFMNDLQMEAEESDGLGDDIMAAAAASFDDDDDDLDGGYTGGGSSGDKKSSSYDDTPRETNTPDILPSDLGLGSATDANAGAQLFASAIMGQTGDKSKRNGVRRVRRDY